MLSLLVNAVLALSCEVEFKKFLDQDLRPRASLFLSGQEGLDWLGGYGDCLPSECNQDELTQILSSYARELIPKYNHTLDFIEFSKTIEEDMPENISLLPAFWFLLP